MKTESLQIHHIAKRLPYGLRVINGEYNGKYKPHKMSAFKILNTITIDEVLVNNAKPILFPISCLTESITVNGETFVPKERLREISGAFEPQDEFKNTFNIHIVEGILTGFNALCIHVNQFELLEKLLEWHIDTDSLVEKGLAISVFDLDKNPYA